MGTAAMLGSTDPLVSETDAASDEPVSEAVVECRRINLGERAIDRGRRALRCTFVYYPDTDRIEVYRKGEDTPFAYGTYLRDGHSTLPNVALDSSFFLLLREYRERSRRE